MFHATRFEISPSRAFKQIKLESTSPRHSAPSIFWMSPKNLITMNPLHTCARRTASLLNKLPPFEQVEYDPRHCLPQVLNETCFRVDMELVVGKPWARTEGRASTATPKTCQNAATSVSSSWLSKKTVLMMNWCRCECKNANEFLKLSTTMCMSMRPWAEICPDDANLRYLCIACAQQPMLTNHSRRQSKFDSFGSSPCAFLS